MAKTPKTPKKYTPVRITTDKDRKIDMEPLFYIDDEEFSVPVQVPPNIALKFLRDLRGGNETQAVALALDNLLGEESVRRLAECDDLEPEQLAEILDVVKDKLMAAGEGLQGN